MSKSEGSMDTGRNNKEVRKKVKRQRLSGIGKSKVWLRTRRRVRKNLLGGR